MSARDCDNWPMSMMENPAVMPDALEWDVADRMRKALRIAGMTNLEMAEYLGVSPTSVSAWMGGRQNPKKQTLRLWALRTGTPFEWLTTGECPRQDSNLRPRDYLAVVSVLRPRAGGDAA